MQNFPILSITILVPLLSALYILIFVQQSHNPSKFLHSKYVALLASILTFISSVYLVMQFKTSGPHLQFEEKHLLVSSINMYYHVATDGISVLLILLTTLLSIICILAGMHSITKKVKEFLVCFLILEAMVIGVFASVDILLFYLFFEATLIPMFLIIGIWGGEDRIYATLKFFIYTLFGSVFFLLAIIYLYYNIGSFNMYDIQLITQGYTLTVQKYLWMATFIAFAVKVPIWPFHTWLPDAHVQAPTSGSVMLAGVLIKMGAYGFIRFSLPMFPDASVYFAPFVICLSIIAIIYTSLVAFAQTNMKKMIAYSSVAHMGYVMIGIFSFNSYGFDGAIFQMLSHGVVSAALFLVVGSLYDRMHSKEIEDYGGVASRMPIFATFFLIFVMSSVGLPGTSGFVGEFLSLFGLAQHSLFSAILAGTGIVLGAIYMLSLYRRIMLGEVTSNRVEGFEDISLIEVCYFGLLAALTIYMGIDSSTITKFFATPVSILSEIFTTYKL
jgi:NADH-quinone oxidoreductase subunit M